MRPLIGISSYAESASYWIMEDEDVVLLPRNYVDWVVAAGGVPVLLPPVEGSADAVDSLDGLIVAGGPDIGPSNYGAAPGPHTDPPRVERDASDLAVLRRALDREVPVLGICRGHQLLNVAAGGTVYQHLPDDLGAEVAAVHAAGPADFLPVDVEPEPGSQIEAALGTGPVRVRCHHHQAVARLGSGLRVAARCGDMIEAVETEGPGWAVGVQWHPERVASDLRLARALVDAAAGRAGGQVRRAG
ncbi:gamma-glutamyl-gamma-aminobutyrate hydrolase family protein [Pseudonocardia parietis]|uniref:Glutamine amidotransferase n=1 Tax=Pseudonocardia parietis TaxID=570936 RepID=A0ABS4VW95_9PSEU|nr:gamma-glutamyl-gamma-aminobutyrate hydrolase family protein [Pseudonocardia parietis]MBP2368204.1 putative glutamine amidotransferase [Pseudonocardia parietis]